MCSRAGWPAAIASAMWSVVCGYFERDSSTYTEWYWRMHASASPAPPSSTASVSVAAIKTLRMRTTR